MGDSAKGSNFCLCHKNSIGSISSHTSAPMLSLLKVRFVVYAALLIIGNLQYTAVGFSISRILRSKGALVFHSRLFSTPDLGGQEVSSILDDNSDDEDEDFAAMQREIDAMIASSAPEGTAAAVSVTVNDIAKYNKLVAVASAVLGSFFFVFQHSQPVSGVALMHAMEKDSMDINVSEHIFHEVASL